jgi:hypothetical protein
MSQVDQHDGLSYSQPVQFMAVGHDSKDGHNDQSVRLYCTLKNSQQLY